MHTAGYLTASSLSSRIPQIIAYVCLVRNGLCRRLCPAPTEVGAAGRHEDDHDHRQRRRREEQPSSQGPPPDPLLEPQRGPLEAAGLRGQSVALPDQGVEAVPALQQGVDAGQDRGPQTRDLPSELRGGVGLPQVLGLLAESEESRKPSPGPHHQVAEHRPEGALACRSWPRSPPRGSSARPAGGPRGSRPPPPPPARPPPPGGRRSRPGGGLGRPGRPRAARRAGSAPAAAAPGGRGLITR